MGEMVSGRETARAGAMLALLLYAFPLSGGGGSSPVAIRGPYLQLATTDSITVCWRTDIPTDSSVVFGPNPGSLNSSVFIPGPVTDHRVTVIGLDPDTTYFYAIGTGLARLAGGDVDHYFSTSPLEGTAKPTRIWILGDPGTGNTGAEAVRDAYYNLNGDPHADLVVTLGDNAYPDGTDADYQTAFFDVYPLTLRNSILWPALGNHDATSSNPLTQIGPYFAMFSLPKNGQAGGVASGTESYYAFDYANVHFVVLDSHASDRSPTGAMLTWLETDLADTVQDWIIVYWHHPPYSKGGHDSDTELRLMEMRQNVVPILDDNGVDLSFTGHSHSFERSVLLDGHYGASTTLTGSMILNGLDGRIAGDGPYEKLEQGPDPHSGIVHTVAGSAGHTSGGSLDHPAMFISLNVLGSLVLDIDDQQADVRFLDDQAVVRDHFTMVKSINCTDPDADGICLIRDNCPDDNNPTQADVDGDGQGDDCDPCPVDSENDADGDGFCESDDNCPNAVNPMQRDFDLDGIGNICDSCPLDPNDDGDEDGFCADVDNCPNATNPGQEDADGDGPGDPCDMCPHDPLNDLDGDGLCAGVDNCFSLYNPDQDDVDLDAVGDGCDPCSIDFGNDSDGDGVCGDSDNCPLTANPSQFDTDGDEIGDACDVGPDPDGDGFPDGADNCPAVWNADQNDLDADGLGDLCDDDRDGDGVADASDCSLAVAGAASPPAEPSLFADKQGGPRVHWNAAPGANAFHVYRVRVLPGEPPPGGMECYAAEYPGLSVVDVDLPPVGAYDGYLASGLNACGESSLGVGLLASATPSIPCVASGLDSDSDGIVNVEDTCALVKSAAGSDVDGDFVGDLCDNCPTAYNPGQEDSDRDGIGDSCAGLVDVDHDGVEDLADNCPLVPNTLQIDLDGEGTGDSCDLCPQDAAKTAPGQCGCGTAESTTIADDFSVSGAPPPGWTALNGSWASSGGILTPTSGTHNVLIYYSAAETCTVDQWVAFEYTTLGCCNGGAFRQVSNDDAAGRYVVRYLKAFGKFAWEYRTGSDVTGPPLEDSGASSFALQNGDRVGIHVAGVGSQTVVRVWLDPIGAEPGEWGPPDWISTVDPGPGSYADVGKHVGLYNGSGSTKGTFDDFSAGSP